MKNDIIKIPANDYGKLDVNEHILISLGKIKNNYRFILKDPNGHLNSLIKEYEENINNDIKSLQSRLNTWKKLIGKYYKMTCETVSNGFSYNKISYIFPYKVIDANKTLWLLEVKEGDDYYGGVKDKCYTVDEDWNYDTYLEEITEEDFRNKGYQALKHVIDRRLNKLNEPQQQYKIISDEDELDK